MPEPKPSSYLSRIKKSAAAAGTEGGAVGLALGVGFLVLDADLACGAAAVNGVVLAVGHGTADAGNDVVTGFIVPSVPPIKIFGFSRIYYLRRRCK